MIILAFSGGSNEGQLCNQAAVELTQDGGAVMLLESYRMEIFNSACNPGAMAVHCFAHLDQDIGGALPYLNAALADSNTSRIRPRSPSRPRAS